MSGNGPFAGDSQFTMVCTANRVLGILGFPCQVGAASAWQSARRRMPDSEFLTEMFQVGNGQNILSGELQNQNP